MDNTGLSKSDLQLIIATVSSCDAVQELILFGSRAKGTYKRGSDVDLAVKGRNLNYDQVVSLEAELNENQPLPYSFDLIDYAGLDNPELKSHIDRVGVSLYSRES